MFRPIGEHWNKGQVVKLSDKDSSGPAVRSAGAGLVLAAVVVFLAVAEKVSGILDEAHTFAMEAALTQVEQGFTVREDYWNGELKPGEKKIIRHQLFKGNEYWFWLGSSANKAWPSVSVYDATGKLVQVESLREMNKASARVLPPKTGTYVVLISVEAEDAEIVDWALAYGFR